MLIYLTTFLVIIMKVKKKKIIFPSFEDNTNIIEIKKEKIKSSDLLYLCNYWETDKAAATEHQAPVRPPVQS